MKKIFYWSPCLDIIGTVKSTFYSAISLTKFSKQNNQIKLINVCGEWNNYKKLLKDKKVEVIDLNKNYYQFLPKKGFFQSRFSSLVIIFLSFLPLFKLLKKENQIL